MYLFSTFINWTSQNTTDMLGYVTALISDITPLLIPIIAISVGLIIVIAIIRALKG